MAREWKSCFSVSYGYFQSFALPYLQASVKLLVKYIFYQFLAISSTKMPEELVHPSTGNIRYISILLTTKGFDLVFKHLQG